MVDIRNVLQKTIVLAAIGITLYSGSFMVAASAQTYKRSQARKVGVDVTSVNDPR